MASVDIKPAKLFDRNAKPSMYGFVRFTTITTATAARRATDGISRIGRVTLKMGYGKVRLGATFVSLLSRRLCRVIDFIICIMAGGDAYD